MNKGTIIWLGLLCTGTIGGFVAGNIFGQMGERISLGNAAYDAIWVIEKQLEDDRLQGHLQTLLANMNPKNAGDAPNERAMRAFVTEYYPKQ